MEQIWNYKHSVWVTNLELVKCQWNWMTASYTNNLHQLRNVIMLLLAEVKIIRSMGQWNSIVDCANTMIHWAALCVDSKC